MFSSSSPLADISVAGASAEGSATLNGFFQMKTLPDALALTMYLLLGLKRTAVIMAECPKPICVVIPVTNKQLKAGTKIVFNIVE